MKLPTQFKWKKNLKIQESPCSKGNMAYIYIYAYNVVILSLRIGWSQNIFILSHFDGH